jgi:hypothetical protein
MAISEPAPPAETRAYNSLLPAQTIGIDRRPRMPRWPDFPASATHGMVRRAPMAVLETSSTAQQTGDR